MTKVIKIISEWKKKPNKKFPSHKKKMVEAIVEEDGREVTRHVAIEIKKKADELV